MKKIIFASLVLFAVSCTKNVDNVPNVSTVQSSNSENAAIVLHRNTKFGSIINGNFDINGRISVANSLNADYVRSSIIMSEWRGKANDYETYVNNGIGVVLNILYESNNLQDKKRLPFTKNLTDYRNKFIEITNKYHPEVIVVENEEYNKDQHSGPMTDYINLLKVALSVCRPKGIKVTNGGIYGRQVEVLTYRYLQTKGQKRADSFANACMEDYLIKAAQNPGSNPTVEAEVKQLDTLLNYYPNLDYVNIHLYEPYNPDVDARTVATGSLLVPRDIQECIRAKTGRPLMTNETFARNNTVPSLITSMMQNYDQLDFPYVIWYSGEETQIGGNSLYNLNTGALYPTGLAFSNFNKYY